MDTNITENTNTVLEQKARWYRLIALILASVITVLGSGWLSYAWLSRNVKTQQSGLMFNLSTDMDEDFWNNNGSYVEIYSADEYKLSALDSTKFLPGTEAEFEIGLVNLSGKVLIINKFGIEEPLVYTGSKETDSSVLKQYNEVPVYDAEGNRHYYGQQIQIAVEQYMIFETTIDRTDEGTVSNIKLADTARKTVPVGTEGEVIIPTNTDLRLLGTDLENPGRLEMVTLNEALDGVNHSIILGINEALIFRMKINFVDAGNQNEFIGFGSADDCSMGKCQRCIFVAYNGFLEVTETQKGLGVSSTDVPDNCVLTYKWYKENDSTNVLGTESEFEPSAIGNYYCKVTITTTDGTNVGTFNTNVYEFKK